MYHKVTLYRRVDENIRYYFLVGQKTLFDDYEVEICYGALRNRDHTGVKRYFFGNVDHAQRFLLNKMRAKKRKGYCEEYKGL